MKGQILEQLIARFNGMIAKAESDRAFAQQEANSHKGAMASRYDTFKQEAQFMVAGCEKRISELTKSVCALREFAGSPALLRGPASTVKAGAIVTVLNSSGIQTVYFVLPAGGGEEITVDNRIYRTLTPMSPLGRALLNREAGDCVEFQVDNKKQTLEIVDIA
jgi:transcription elongation GreA/GreB family factor